MDRTFIVCQICLTTDPISSFDVKATFRVGEVFGMIGDIKLQSGAQFKKVAVRALYYAVRTHSTPVRKTNGSFFETDLWPQITRIYTKSNSSQVSAFTTERITIFGEYQISPHVAYLLYFSFDLFFYNKYILKRM
jgi:hypothetical protein